MTTLVLVTGVVDYCVYPEGRCNQGCSGNWNENRLWLGYPWYFGSHSAVQEKVLTSRLMQGQIRYAYFL